MFVRRTRSLSNARWLGPNIWRSRPSPFRITWRHQSRDHSISGSRDVINHVTIRFAIFLLVLPYFGTEPLALSVFKILASKYSTNHDFDFFGSRDVKITISFSTSQLHWISGCEKSLKYLSDTLPRMTPWPYLSWLLLAIFRPIPNPTFNFFAGVLIRRGYMECN